MYKIITPAVTILDQHERPDHETNKKVIDLLVNGGVDGTLVPGPTDEFTGMDRQEKSDFFRLYMGYTAGRVELYVETGSVSFQDAVALSNEVRDMGYVGPMVIGPYHYGMDQEKLFIYCDTSAESVEGSPYMYNYPARIGCSIAPSTVARLLEANPNIAGLKGSVSEPSHTNLVCLVARGYSFDTYSGLDDQYLYNTTSRGNECIGGLSNLVPEIWSALVKTINNKDFHRSMELSRLTHELIPLYDPDSDFSLLSKKVMNHRGLGVTDGIIFPYDQMGDETFQRAIELVDQVPEKFRVLSNHQGQCS